MLGVDDQEPETPGRIAGAVVAGRIDGILAANATSGLQSVEGVARVNRRGA